MFGSFLNGGFNGADDQHVKTARYLEAMERILLANSFYDAILHQATNLQKQVIGFFPKKHEKNSIFLSILHNIDTRVRLAFCLYIGASMQFRWACEDLLLQYARESLRKFGIECQFLNSFFRRKK